MFNIAFLPVYPVADLSRAVRDVSNKAAQHGVRVNWLVRDTIDRNKVERELLAQEYTVSGTWLGMFFPLSQVLQLNDYDMAVSEVTSDADFAEWLSVVNISADVPKASAKIFNELFSSLDWRLSDRWIPFLLRVQDVAVSACMLFRHQSAAGVYWVATCPEHRRRGYASAIVSYALRRAAALGHEVAILHSVPDAVNLYRHLGFSGCGNIHLFRQPVGSLDSKITY